MDDLVILVDQPIRIRLDGGMVRFEINSGHSTYHFAMSPHIFFESRALGAEVERQWRGGHCEVVELGH